MSKHANDLYRIADNQEQNGYTDNAKRLREAGKRIEILESIVLESIVIVNEEINK